MVERPSRMAVRGWKDLLEVREGSVGYPGGPGEVGRPSWRAGRCLEAHQKGREELGGPPRGPGGVGRLSLRARSDLEDFQWAGRVWEGWEGFGDPSKGL